MNKKYFGLYGKCDAVTPFKAFVTDKDQRDYLVVVKPNTIFSLTSDGVEYDITNNCNINSVVYAIKTGVWVELTKKDAFNLIGIHSTIDKPDFSGLIAAFSRIDENDGQEFDNIDCNEVWSIKSPMLYRYSRFYHDDGSVQGNGGFGFGIIIDYDKKLLEVYPTICDTSETFSKAYARGLIEQRHKLGIGFTVEYDMSLKMLKNIETQLGYAKVISHEKITNDLIAKLKKFKNY